MAQLVSSALIAPRRLGWRFTFIWLSLKPSVRVEASSEESAPVGTWQANLAFIDDLKVSGHTRSPFHLELGLTTEPAVMQYVIDALCEEDEEPVELSSEEFWHILRVLKTVADCLHDASIASEGAA